MWTTKGDPPPAAVDCRWGRAARSRRMGARVLRVNRSMTTWSGTSVAGPNATVPAAKTRPSSRPYLATARSTTFSAAPALRRSAGTHSASSPRAASRSPSRPVRVSCAPAAASRRLSGAPSPPVAPATRTRAPSSSVMPASLPRTGWSGRGTAEEIGQRPRSRQRETTCGTDVPARAHAPDLPWEVDRPPTPVRVRTTTIRAARLPGPAGSWPWARSWTCGGVRGRPCLSMT